MCNIWKSIAIPLVLAVTAASFPGLAAPANTSNQQVQISPNPVDFVVTAYRIVGAIDQGAAAQIWDNASPVMKTIVTRDQFVRTALQRKTTSGVLQGRAWRSIMRIQMAQPQGQLPAGNYLTVNFAALNKDAKGMVETVSFVLDGDQQWRLVGITVS